MEQLKMYRYVQKKDGTTTDASLPPFSVMLNPSEIKRSFSISYSKRKAQGSQARDQKLNAVGNESLSFSIVIDGTGAVPSKPGVPFASVDTQLTRLRAVVYTEPGATDEIARVPGWGQFVFRGRLETMGIDQTLFAPDGSVLRAKVQLAFVSAVSTKEAELSTSLKSNDDVAQQRTVGVGDTLPAMCQSVYGDPGYSAEVARYNGLSSLRDVSPGTVLVFPPLASAA